MQEISLFPSAFAAAFLSSLMAASIVWAVLESRRRAAEARAPFGGSQLDTIRLWAAVRKRVGLVNPLQRLIPGCLWRRQRRVASAADRAFPGLGGLGAAVADSAREWCGVHRERAAGFSLAELEILAGRPRAEVLAGLGRPVGSAELRKLAAVRIDSDRFGSSLAPALRTYARYLRTHRRQRAQEAARKLAVKLIFPVFFRIMPAVLVVTLGPALLSLREAFSGLLDP